MEAGRRMAAGGSKTIGEGRRAWTRELQGGEPPPRVAIFGHKMIPFDCPASVQLDWACNGSEAMCSSGSTTRTSTAPSARHSQAICDSSCQLHMEPCRPPRGPVPLVANHSWRPCDACSRCGIPRLISPHDARSVGPIRGCPILILHESSQVDKWLGKKRALFVKRSHLHCRNQWNKRRRNAAFDVLETR